MEGFDLLEEEDGAARPDGPLAEEAAGHAEADAVELEGGEEVVEDVVVVTGVEGDVVGAAAGGEGADDIKGVIAVEGGDLDGDDVGDGNETAPEVVAEDAAADGRLEVEAEDGEDGGEVADMVEDGVLGVVAEGGEAEQGGIVAKAGGEFGFADGLGGEAADAGDGGAAEGAPLLKRELENGLEQAMVANGELGGMDADGDGAGAGLAVIAGEGALGVLVESACGGESQWVSRDDEAGEEVFAEGHQNFPSRASKWVGLPRERPPAAIQFAVQVSMRDQEMVGLPKRA